MAIDILKYFKRLVVSALFISALPCDTFAQDNEWKLYNKENTVFPGALIRDIAMDKDGNKWIAHSYGLVKLSGSIWKSFDTKNSGLPDNDVYSIAVDSVNNLWIGSATALTKYDGRTWTSFTGYRSFLKSTNHLENLAVDRDGNIWVGIGQFPSGRTGSGLFKFDGRTWTSYNTANSVLPDNPIISSIEIDIDGTIWIGCDFGLAKYDAKTWTLFNKSNSGMPSDFVSSVSIDSKGDKWIGCYDHGVVRFDGNRWTVYDTSNSPLPDNNVYDVAFDSQENTWIGTYRGLAKYDHGNWEIFNTTNSKLPANVVKSIAIDSKDTVWIGLTEAGLAILYQGNWTILNQYSPNHLPDDGIVDIKMDSEGCAWVATHAGLAKFNGMTWTVYTAENSPIPSSEIYDIEIDSQNNIWIASEKGLAKFKNDTWEIFDTTNSGLPLYNSVKHLSIDPQGNLWMATGQPLIVSAILKGSGLTKFDGHSWTVYNTENSGLPCNYISCINVDKHGIVWMGTGIFDSYVEGLVRFDGNNWKTYNVDNSGIPSNIVNAIAFDENDNKWIGTGSYLNADHTSKSGGGLAKFDDLNWSTYSKENSLLPSNDVTALLFDNHHNIWVGTAPYYTKNNEPSIGGGLACFNGISWKVYNTETSRLPSNVITSLVFDSGSSIWIGTSPQWIGNGNYTVGGIAVYNAAGLVLNCANEEVPNLGRYSLFQNHPNPFNPSTRIEYSVPWNSYVSLKVYDLLGQEVATLYAGVRQPGRYVVTFDGSKLASGFYFCRMQANANGSSNFVETKKLILLK
jgi:ligand-binding sensor domain-containing protein